MTSSKSEQTEKLAIDGGTPARSRPNPPMYPGGNMIGAEEEQAVLEVLRSKRLFRYYGPNPGPSKVAQLEQARRMTPTERVEAMRRLVELGEKLRIRPRPSGDPR